MEKSKSKRKTRQTRQSSKDNNEDNKIESDRMEGTTIGKDITYDVLRMILEYSNIRDLTRAAMVCRSWNVAAKQEIRMRIQPQDILHEWDPVEKKNQLAQTFIDQLLIKPHIGLFFVGKRVQNSTSQCLNADDCLCHRVPHETDCITVWNYGLVYDNLELGGDVVSGLFLPKISAVRIKSFNIDRLKLAQFRTTTNKRSREKLARKFFKIPPNEKRIRSIILFANQEAEDLDENSQSDDVKQILKALTSQQTNDNGEKISIWGGVTSKLTVCSSEPNAKCEHAASLAGISICGSGITTWSVVLDRRIKTKVQAEKELTAFRDGVKLMKYSAGFMFACCGRGEDWYSEKHVEPKIFKKLFPNVPLVGSFGGGEYGVTTIPQGCSKVSGIVHEYSTIFLIITYGPAVFWKQ